MNWHKTISGTRREVADQLRKWLLENATQVIGEKLPEQEQATVFAQMKGAQETIVAVAREFADDQLSFSMVGDSGSNGSGYVTVTYTINEPSSIPATEEQHEPQKPVDAPVAVS